MSISLYNNNAIETAFEVLESTGELSPCLSIEQDALQVKAVEFSEYYRQLASDEAAIDEEIKRLQALKKKAQARIQFVETTISDAMQIAGISKIETPTVKLSFWSSSSVKITEEFLIPPSFFLVKTEIDKAKIRKTLLAGEEVEGAELEHKQNLQIK